jgi:hypothetical protein
MVSIRVSREKIEVRKIFSGILVGAFSWFNLLISQPLSFLFLIISARITGFVDFVHRPVF